MTYTMSLDDFPHGCLVVTDALTGRRIATGRCARGDVVTTPLDVPLCSTCEEPVGECLCERVEADLRATLEMQKRRAA